MRGVFFELPSTVWSLYFVKEFYFYQTLLRQIYLNLPLSMSVYRRKLEKHDHFLNNYIIHYIVMSFNLKTAFSSFYLTVVCILSSDLPLNF